MAWSGSLRRVLKHWPRDVMPVRSSSVSITYERGRVLKKDGMTIAELRHVALLAITTTGWSRGVAALDWIERVANDKP